MLKSLYIHNYALIDTLEIEFGEGLNIITGETGAGKSIILGALSLILGQRADSRQLFAQDRKCIIEGVFDVSSHHLGDLFEEFDLDFAPETYIRREFTAEGKSRAFINDTPVNLQVLKRFSERLIDIHSQHATLQVANPDFQLMVLDSLAGQVSARQEFSSMLSRYKKAQSELSALIQRAEQRASEVDYKQFLLDELHAAQLEAGEVARLEGEQTRLEHAEEIKIGLLGAVAVLTEDERHVTGLLREALQSLSRSAAYMNELEEPEQRLESALIELKDIAAELEQHADNVSVDGDRLMEVQDRLNLLYTLQQKHRVQDPDELLDKLQEIEAELDAVNQDETAIEDMRKTCDRLEKQLVAQAEVLRQGRVNVSEKFTNQVLRILETIGMPDSQLHIQLQALEFADYRSDGGDAIRFLFTANKGQTPQDVGRVASGGELSRLMLAMKTVVAEYTALPTIIFDEIDTGISGEVALRVGDVLSAMGGQMQVVTITHLPQIAARGATHFKVYKEDASERTSTHMALLAESERVHEIAQMLSGADPGPAAIAHAQTLLKP